MGDDGYLTFKKVQQNLDAQGKYSQIIDRMRRKEMDQNEKIIFYAKQNQHLQKQIG